MALVPNYQALRAEFNGASQDVRNYFWPLPNLMSAQLGVAALAYAFFKIEQAQIRTLYGGLLRLHRANSTFTRQTLDREYLTRPKFRELYRNVMGVEIPADLTELIQSAEAVRDRLMHGRQPRAAEIRNAIATVLRYAIALGQTVQAVAGFNPCGDMRGVTGTRAQRLDVRTTKWVLKGMGFSVG